MGWEEIFDGMYSILFFSYEPFPFYFLPFRQVRYFCTGACTYPSQFSMKRMEQESKSGKVLPPENKIFSLLTCFKKIDQQFIRVNEFVLFRNVIQ
jgi:hypothetical protein